MYRRLLKGVKVNDEELAVKVINEIKHDGNYLSHEHTYNHCRDVYQPMTFYQLGRNSGRPEEKTDILERAKNRAIQILEEN